MGVAYPQFPSGASTNDTLGSAGTLSRDTRMLGPPATARSTGCVTEHGEMGMACLFRLGCGWKELIG